MDRRPPGDRAAARASGSEPPQGRQRRATLGRMIGRLRRAGEPPARRAARPARRRDLGEGGVQARPRRRAVLALLVLAAAPPAAGADVPGSAQPAPGLARALGELGVGAEAFAALPAAARGLFGLLVGIKAAAGACFDALRLERANSSFALDCWKC